MLLALLLAIATPSAPQANDIEQYRGFVDAYRAGRVDPVQELATWKAPRVEAVVEHCPAEALLACTLLHTDAAIALLSAKRIADAEVHLYKAVTLLDAVLEQAPERLRFAQRWYVTIRGYLQTLDAPAWAEDLGDRARRRVPYTPAQYLFIRGLESELAAAVAGPFSSSQFGQINGVHPTTVGHLIKAGREYESVVKVEQDYHQAWLHLGRVRMVIGQFAAAVDPLDQAARSADRHVAYLALLYRGAAAERQGQLTEAEAYYRKATGMFRWGQSGPVALAQLLSRVGREAEAREVLTDHLSLTAGRVVDPLWTYLVMPGDHLRPSLDALRSEVWR
jgi:tetratricopeptide (TPR) repeat protein